MVRVAVIGLGYWGPNLVRNFNGVGQLHSICDSNEKRLETVGRTYPAAKRFRTVEEVLADPDVGAVAIATPKTPIGSCIRRKAMAR